jgi:hypothetical protein
MFTYQSYPLKFELTHLVKLRDAYEHFIVVEAMMADTKNQDF